jgi:hypothetical protein
MTEAQDRALAAGVWIARAGAVSPDRHAGRIMAGTGRIVTDGPQSEEKEKRSIVSYPRSVTTRVSTRCFKFLPPASCLLFPVPGGCRQAFACEFELQNNIRKVCVGVNLSLIKNDLHASIESVLL